MKIRCPICKLVTTVEENPFKPFCSERCKLVDLGKWVTGEYRIEGEPVNEDAVDSEDRQKNEGETK